MSGKFDIKVDYIVQLISYSNHWSKTMKEMFIALAISLSFNAKAQIISQCHKTMMFAQASDHQVMLHDLAMQHLINGRYFNFMTPVRGQEADLEIVVHEISTTSTDQARRFILTCDIELIQHDQQGRADRATITNRSRSVRSQNKLEMEIRRNCSKAFKELAKKVPMCGNIIFLPID